MIKGKRACNQEISHYRKTDDNYWQNVRSISWWESPRDRAKLFHRRRALKRRSIIRRIATLPTSRTLRDTWMPLARFAPLTNSKKQLSAFLVARFPRTESLRNKSSDYQEITRCTVWFNRTRRVQISSADFRRLIRFWTGRRSLLHEEISIKVVTVRLAVPAHTRYKITWSWAKSRIAR